MDTQAVKQYLGLLMNAFAENAKSAEIADSDDGPVLIVTVASPFDENAEVAYQIAVQPADEMFGVFEVNIFLFTDIDADRYSDISRLINRLNGYSAFGSFRLFDDNGSVMFCQGMVFPEDMDAVRATELLLKTIEAMEPIAADLGSFIYRALNGESGDTLLKELKRRQNDEQ